MVDRANDQAAERVHRDGPEGHVQVASNPHGTVAQIKAAIDAVHAIIGVPKTGAWFTGLASVKTRRGLSGRDNLIDQHPATNRWQRKNDHKVHHQCREQR